MRTRRLPIVLALALIASSSFVPLSHAASSSSDAGQAPSLIVANFEQWLLSTVQQVEEMLGLEAPQTGSGSYPPSIQSDCRSGIDPNGGGCTS